MGEGNLPGVCVLRPARRTHGGSPVLEFRRELVGRTNTLPLVLLNDGTVAAQVGHQKRNFSNVTFTILTRM